MKLWSICAAIGAFDTKRRFPLAFNISMGQSGQVVWLFYFPRSPARVKLNNLIASSLLSASFNS